MTSIRAIFNAFTPEYLERYPNLPTSHHKVLSAIQHCRSGHYGHSLSPCQSCGGQPRVPHACGHRHCPQCQHHTTQQWLHRRLEKQLPGPHFLITFTVPETLRPFIRSHQHIAYPAMFKASATALKRLAHAERFIGTHFPGFPGILHTWGRHLQFPPHIHSIGPGGGLSQDGSQWLPSRANFSVPVKALSPISRALLQEDRRHAGLLAQSDRQVWNIPWNVHSQAHPHAHSAWQDLAPYVFKVALSNRRIVGLKDRTVTFTSRKPGSVRPRTTTLDAIAFLRRFLQHVVPDGFLKVRHCGLLHASCAIPPDTIRLMIVQAPPAACPLTPLTPPAPFVAFCPPCGGQMRVVMRLWTTHRAFADTG